MAFRPLLCMRIDEETDIRIYESDMRKKLLNWWIKIEHICGNGFPG
ncbi:MAG TPA: hypothetical protein VNW73_13470 [Ktedonobacteraceae bacterium]|nr:hypothetical protein [Ktedonobacteraceae bacterium]